MYELAKLAEFVSFELVFALSDLFSVRAGISELDLTNIRQFTSSIGENTYSDDSLMGNFLHFQK